MTDHIENILTEAIQTWPNHPWLVLPGPTDLAPGLAAHLATALKMARIAVVDLPERTRHVPACDEHNEDARLEWNTGIALVSAYQSPPEVFVDSEGMEPAQAYELAAAILAARHAAEES
ncbi:hypothetical protein [Mycobacterium phage WXIN]|nr:hypothetical protein [Mycobacterium phage WXIN]